jgi:hypothetical protein
MSLPHDYHSDNNGKHFKSRRIIDRPTETPEQLVSEVSAGKPMGVFQIPQAAESISESEEDE